MQYLQNLRGMQGEPEVVHVTDMMPKSFWVGTKRLGKHRHVAEMTQKEAWMERTGEDRRCLPCKERTGEDRRCLPWKERTGEDRRCLPLILVFEMPRNVQALGSSTSRMKIVPMGAAAGSVMRPVD